VLETVLKTIDANKGLYLEWLRTLLRQPSVAAQNRGMRETATLVQQLLSDVGLKSEQLATSGFPVVYGESLGRSAKTLSFYNHYDVQPEDPLELWDAEPFGAEVRDGRLYARGAADNKGNLVARLAAVHAYRQTHGELPLHVKFIVEGEEEIGSPHLHEVAERHADKLQTDGCIWEFGYKEPGGRLQISLGVKGICYLELRAKGANTDLHSSQAAVVPNPAWRLVWALSTLKNARDEVLIEGFYERVRAPSKREVEILREMAFDETAMLKALGLERFIEGLSGEALKRKLIYEPTCTICGLEAGYTGEGSKTVLPSRAKVKLDFRLVPDQDPAEIRALLRRHLDAHGFGDIELIDLGGEHPAKTDPSEPLVGVVMESVERIYGQSASLVPMSPGSGPMYILCQQLGIPAVSVGVGHSRSNTHAPNENIELEDFFDGIKLIAAVMNRFAER
jgi:acetylornithine deacetylase/succinyl-diaminopimelate desuccinylase-like protein